MKKWLLVILSIMLLFSVKNCYANESNIKIDTYRNENFVVEFSIGDEKVYGFTTTLEYDSNKFKLNNCTAHNGYEISTYQNNIVVESITAKKNVKAATCYFEILDSKETTLTIKNINTGNYDEVSVEKDMQLKVLGNKTPTQVENIPDTAEGIGMGYILLGCTLTICGGVIIFLLFNKKYSILCSIAIALCLAIPGRVDAAKDKINLSESDLSGARNILLGKEESNLDYDFDGDEKITINDLVITKVDLSKLQVTFVPSGTYGKTAYYNLSIQYKINSTSQIENVEYCVKSTVQACNYQKVNKTFTNSYLSELREIGPIGNAKQQMCVKATNKDGLTRNVCSTGYLVDPTVPSISLNASVSNVITGCYNIESNLRNSFNSHFKTTFGFSGGELKLNGVTKTSSGSGGYEIYRINVKAMGNNGTASSSSKEIKCNKKVAFVGDNLSSTSSGGLKNISLGPAIIDTTKLMPNVPYQTIISSIYSLSEPYDKVIITAGYYEKRRGNYDIVNAVKQVASAARSKFGSNVLFVLYGKSTDVYLSKTQSSLNSIGIKSIVFYTTSSAGYYIDNSEISSLSNKILNNI